MDVKPQLTIEELIESFKSENNLSVYEAELSDYDREKIRNWPSIECPFFSDEEIEQLKDYYHESGTESYHDYFNKSMLTMNTVDVNTHTKSYGDRIIELQNKLKAEQDPEKIDEIKQNMVDLGWNPEVEYTVESQMMARERFMRLEQSDVNILDISSLVNHINDSVFTEGNIEEIYPVSIVLVQGDSAISYPIHAFTGCKYTHSALALDDNFNKLYSFNFDNKIKLGGGFSLESIKDYPKDNNITIYTFFVRKNDYDKLSSKVQEYLLNIKNTTYSVATFVLFPFRDIKLHTSDSMICSQFVDSCMKLINVDITSKDSSKVSPADLYHSAGKKEKVYKVYEGPTKNFDSKKISKFLKKLSKSAKVINESGVIDLDSFILSEARKANFEINNNGDILLTNPFVDFDAEYMNSHKLLMQYDKARNIEGMKYELARLYYMNYILEKKLYHNKFLNNKEKNMKTRARVLNDFNKYLKILLKYEPDFNFGEYYEQSPFYPHTVEVKQSTIKGIKDIFNYIL